MSLITDVFSPTEGNGRFEKPEKCKYCNKEYTNIKSFCNHQNKCNDHYTEDGFITDEIIYEEKKKSSNKSPKRSSRRIIVDDEDEDENIKKKEIIEDSEIIEDGEIIKDDKNNKDGEIIEDSEIIEDINNINKRKNNDNIINKNIYNKLIPKRKRTEKIFIKKHDHSNGLEVDPNFTKIKSDEYFKYDNKDIITFNNKKIIINSKNINKLTINL
jgi:hypothetical protein